MGILHADILRVSSSKSIPAPLCTFNKGQLIGTSSKHVSCALFLIDVYYHVMAESQKLEEFMHNSCSLLVFGVVKTLLRYLFFNLCRPNKDFVVYAALSEDHHVSCERACLVCENELDLSKLLNEVAITALREAGFFVVDSHILSYEVSLAQLHNFEHNVEGYRDHVGVSHPEGHKLHDVYLESRVRGHVQVSMALGIVSLPNHAHGPKENDDQELKH